MTEIVVPAVGESISEVQISQWLKKEGDWVSAGTDLVDLETEKASVQVSAPADGYLVKILKPNDQFATVGEVIAEFQPAAKGAAPSNGAAAPAGSPAPTASVSAPAATGPAATAPAEGAPRVMPAAKRMMEDQNVSLSDVTATGPGGRVLKEDVARAASSTAPASSAPVTKHAASSGALEPAARPMQTAVATTTVSPSNTGLQQGTPNRSEEIKPMSMIRRTIATRLVQAQHNAALLSTFNEIDMQPV
ncbi:MAG: biotin/lipoyl-containing protein, partial [Pirellula sp.]